MKRKKNRPPKTRATARPYIVGIGASAGGLEAFKLLLAHLPVDTGMAFIFVQHLSPRHESLLSEILGRMTQIPVIEVKASVRVEPDHIFVIPPNAMLEIDNGILRLLPREDRNHPPMPIDHFFRSLAADQGEYAIGVVLSGTGSDGAEGAKVIKAEGGITFAQTPESARFDSMPTRAIVADDIDHVLSPEDIALELVNIGQLTSAQVHRRAVAPPMKTDPNDFSKILQLLKQTTGTDFSQYKPTTLRRRVARRMLLQKTDSLKKYLKLLATVRDERLALNEDLLINVTTFFREPESFEYLAQTVFPDLLKNKAPDDPIRIWIPGCSTGEEAYSIGMVLFEAMGDPPSHHSIQIFATDLSEKSIDRARLGKYGEGISVHVSPERLRTFFVPISGGYRVNKSIRDVCIFAKHDLSRDPPFSRLDLISCRNLLIYMGHPLQTRIMETFHYSLNPDGYLLLGASESVGTSSDLFAPADPGTRFYIRKSASARRRPHPVKRDITTLVGSARKAIRSPPHDPASLVEIQIESDRAILTRYAPPSIVINSKFDVLQFRGDTEPFLIHRAGEASLNVLKLAREGLAAELKKALRKIKDQETPIRSEGVRISNQTVANVEVIPLRFLLGERCYLVTFEHVLSPDLPKGKGGRKNFRALARGTDLPIHRLKQELALTKENLQGVVRDFELTNQDLQSANEEVVSSNEELQSTNEELETSKEELQSTNEELTTVNDELQSRNDELFGLNNDLLNLLNSVYIPIVIIGNDLSIRRFTPMASKLFNVIPTDVGRPITDITSNVIDVEELRTMIQAVLENAVVQEKEIQDRDGVWFQLRIRPYKTLDSKVEGAVVTLQDINQIRQARDLARSIVDTIKQPLLIVDSSLRVLKANRTFYAFFGVPANQTENHFLYDLGAGQWKNQGLTRRLSEILPKNTELDDFMVEHAFPQLGIRKISVSARQIPRDAGLQKMILLAFEDVTEGTGPSND